MLNKAPQGEYWDYSCNPITGCNGTAFGDKPCPVFERGACFAQAVYKNRVKQPWLNSITFHPDKLKGLNRKKPAIIFLNLMGETFVQDLNERNFFGDTKIIAAFQPLMKEISLHLQHQFLIATKQPQNIPASYPFSDNLWLGVSVCNQWMFDKLIALLKQRGRLFRGGHFWISFEPLYEEIKISPEAVEVLRRAGLEFVTIGGQTKPDIYPKREWIYSLQNFADNLKIPYWAKNNAVHPISKELEYQQFPPSLAEIRRSDETLF